MDAMLDYHPEYSESVRLQAESDAEAVAGFLYALGEITLIDLSKLASYSPEALLGIALALRFRSWELHQLRVHVDAGLPTSDEIFERVRSGGRGPVLQKFVNETWVRAFRVHHDSFLWSASDCDLSAAIAILADEDERFLDAIVDFLHRDAKRLTLK